MKKILFVFLFALFGAVYAQKEIKTITLDFESKEFDKEIESNLKKIKPGDWYQLEINNINMNLYTVNFDKKDSIIPKSSESIGFDRFDLSMLTNLVAAIIPGGNAVIPKTSPSPSIPKGTDSKDPKMSGENKGEFHSTIVPVDSNKIKLEKEIKDRIENEKQTLEGNMSKIRNMNQSIDSINLTIVKEVLDSRYLIPLSADSKTVDNLLIEIEKMRGEIKTHFDLIIKNKSDYNEYSNKNKITEKEEFKKADEAIKKTYDESEKKMEEATRNFSAGEVYKKLMPLIMIQNRGTSYKSLPQQLTGDVNTLKVIIAPVKDTLNLPTYKVNLMLPQNNQYYGTGLSFYGARLHDEVYNIRKNDSADYQIFRQSPQKWEMGTLVAFRFGWNPSEKYPDLGTHFSFGPAISLTSKTKPRITAGGGVSLGQRHKCVLDVGGIVGYSERLSKGYDFNSPYSELPEKITHSRLKGSYFISVGYMYRF